MPEITVDGIPVEVTDDEASRPDIEDVVRARREQFMEAPALADELLAIAVDQAAEDDDPDAEVADGEVSDG